MVGFSIDGVGVSGLPTLYHRSRNSSFVRPAPRTILQDGRFGVPVVRQVRILGGLVSRNGTLGSDGEVDPALAVRTSTDETRVVPPGSHQGVMNGSSVILQAEIDRLHRLPAT